MLTDKFQYFNSEMFWVASITGASTRCVCKTLSAKRDKFVYQTSDMTRRRIQNDSSVNLA